MMAEEPAGRPRSRVVATLHPLRRRRRAALGASGAHRDAPGGRQDSVDGFESDAAPRAARRRAGSVSTFGSTPRSKRALDSDRSRAASTTGDTHGLEVKASSGISVVSSCTSASLPHGPGLPGAGLRRNEGLVVDVHGPSTWSSSPGAVGAPRAPPRRRLRSSACSGWPLQQHVDRDVTTFEVMHPASVSHRAIHAGDSPSSLRCRGVAGHGPTLRSTVMRVVAALLDGGIRYREQEPKCAAVELLRHGRVGRFGVAGQVSFSRGRRMSAPRSASASGRGFPSVAEASSLGEQHPSRDDARMSRLEGEATGQRARPRTASHPGRRSAHRRQRSWPHPPKSTRLTCRRQCLRTSNLAAMTPLISRPGASRPRPRGRIEGFDVTGSRRGRELADPGQARTRIPSAGSEADVVVEERLDRRRTAASASAPGRTRAQAMYSSGRRTAQTFGSTMPQPPSSIHPVFEQTRQPAPSQNTHVIANSADGSVNGKKDGMRRDFSFLRKYALVNASSVPARSPNVMP